MIDDDNLPSEDAENFGPPSAFLAWNFQPNWCEVSVLERNTRHRVWYRHASNCGSMVPAGQTAGCVRTLRINAGGSADVGFLDEHGELRWCPVEYRSGELRSGWRTSVGLGNCSAVWRHASGWRLDARGEYTAPLGLTYGEPWGEPDARMARDDEQRRLLDESWVRHAAETERPRLLKPHIGSRQKFGIWIMPNRPCPACGAPDTWMSTYWNSRELTGYDRVFCPACDSWLEAPCSCDRCVEEFGGMPDRPSQVPMDEALMWVPDGEPS